MQTTNTGAVNNEQWVDLPYCKQCMSSSVDVRFTAEPYFDNFNGRWSAEPCPHGHIVTAPRLAMQKKAKWHSFWAKQVIFLGLCSIFGVDMGGFLGFLILFPLWLLMVAVHLHYQHTMTKMVRALGERPELPGYWESNAKRNSQPWLRRWTFMVGVF